MLGGINPDILQMAVGYDPCLGRKKCAVYMVAAWGRGCRDEVAGQLAAVLCALNKCPLQGPVSLGPSGAHGVVPTVMWAHPDPFSP